MQTTLISSQIGLRYTVGKYTVTGEAVLGEPEEFAFSPVYLEMSTGKTSIRTDKSGTQSRAEEELFDGRILIAPDVTLDFDDIVEFKDKKFRVVRIHPRYEMNHELHHYQVDLMAWDSE